MPVALFAFMMLAFCIRTGSITASRRNERALAEAGAAEYGAGNSTALSLVHVAYYVAAPLEGWIRGWPVGMAAWWGMLVYALGVAWVVAMSVLPSATKRSPGR